MRALMEHFTVQSLIRVAVVSVGSQKSSQITKSSSYHDRRYVSTAIYKIDF